MRRVTYAESKRRSSRRKTRRNGTPSRSGSRKKTRHQETHRHHETHRHGETKRRSKRSVAGSTMTRSTRRTIQSSKSKQQRSHHRSSSKRSVAGTTVTRSTMRTSKRRGGGRNKRSHDIESFASMSLKKHTKKKEVHPEVEVDLQGDVYVDRLLVIPSPHGTYYKPEERQPHHVKQRTNKKATSTHRGETRDQPESHPSKVSTSAVPFKNKSTSPESGTSQELVTATVFKNTPDSPTGLRLKNSGGKVIVCGIVHGGLFEDTPLKTGDVIVAINNVHAKSKNALELSKIIRKAEFFVTILAKRKTTGNKSKTIQRQEQLLAQAQDDARCSLWTTQDTVAFWNLGDRYNCASPTSYHDESGGCCAVCESDVLADPDVVNVVHSATSQCYYCFDVVMNLGSPE